MNSRQILYHLIVFLFVFLQISSAEEIKLMGTVRHANTYREIPYVNIYVIDHTVGTASDPDGFFIFTIPESQDNLIIVFEHVSFDTMQISLSQAQDKKVFYMIPRIIQSSTVEVEAERNYSKTRYDIPQPHSLISSKNFDLQGYVDAGDLLRNEQSVQIEEELSGKKTIAIRAGNPDDVIILYNGIKMNSIYDNIFDLSLINIEDIRHFEVIRGSNTSLYGPEAFSGVINVVPKMYKNYNIRFTQRIGTYASGDWNLQLNYNYSNRLSASYGYKQGGSKREYLDTNIKNQIYLTNSIYNHSANLVYYFDAGDSNPGRSIGLLFLQSGLNHENDKFNESLNNMNRMASINYDGGFWKLKHFSIVGAYQWYNRNHILLFDMGQIEQKYKSKNLNLNLENEINNADFDIFFAYQFERGELDFDDQRNISSEYNIGIESALFRQYRHGIASVFKLHIPTNSAVLKLADLDLSYRYDYVNNDQENIIIRSGIQPANFNFDPEKSVNNTWSESTIKFSSQLLVENRFFRVNGYLNFGSNVKFPTLFQQISSPSSTGLVTQANEPNLNPEKNRSLEIGTSLIKEVNDQGSLNGWQLDLNFFKNYYNNKFRIYYSPGVPIAFYDNVQNADISGIESTIKLFLVKRKITFDMGLSKYFISEKAAFPFKSEIKYVINLFVDHAGYSFRAHGFYENEQTAWIRNIQNEFWEVALPGYSNLDLHLNKSIEFMRLKAFLNLSARNIFDNDTMLEGIAIRDRRYYITFGIQY